MDYPGEGEDGDEGAAVKEAAVAIGVDEGFVGKLGETLGSVVDY